MHMFSMQHRGALRKLLRNTIKSIGSIENHSCGVPAYLSRQILCQIDLQRDPNLSPDICRSNVGDDTTLRVPPFCPDRPRSARARVDGESLTHWRILSDAPSTYGGPRNRRSYSSLAAEPDVSKHDAPSLKSINEVEDNDGSVHQRGQNKTRNTPSSRWFHSPNNRGRKHLEGQGLKSLLEPGPEGEDSPPKLRRNYGQSAQGALRHRTLQQAKRIRLQRSRYPSRMADEWPTIISLLEKASPQGKEHYGKRKESLRFPDGAYANFIGTAGDVFLEIMLRTGCHVRIMPGSPITAERGIHALMFYGTPVQNADALKILPEYVQSESLTDDRASRDWQTYTLQNCDSDEERLVGVGSGNSASRSLIKPPSTNRLKALQPEVTPVEDDLSVQDLLSLGETLRKITYAKTRSVWIHNRNRKEVSIGPPKRPDRWTPASFNAYIDDLVRSPPPTPPKLGLRVGPERQSHATHADRVSEELEALFAERMLAPVTTSAVNHALGFLAKNGKINEGRQILANLEQSGFKLSASSFVMLLDAAASNGDEFNFRNTLEVMARHGVPIIADVWVQVYRLARVTSPGRTKSIVTAMRKKGVFADKSAGLSIMKASIADELTSHFAKGKSLRAFMASCDRTRAPSHGLVDKTWLRVDLLNRMLHACFLSGRMHDAYELVADYRSRHKNPGTSTSTLNTFLSASLRNLDIKSAISALRVFMSDKTGPIQPDGISFTVLFKLAWHKQYFNVCRVVWRYACTHGHADLGMQRKVFRSMVGFPSGMKNKDPALSRARLWHAWAGKFVIDLRDGLYYAPSSYHSNDPSAYLDRVERMVASERGLTVPPSADLERELIRLSDASKFPPSSPEDGARRTRLRHLLVADVDEARSLAPVVPFPDMLERAYQRDIEWKQRGLGLPKGLSDAHDQIRMFSEMMDDSIKVPVKVGNAVLIKTSRAMR